MVLRPETTSLLPGRTKSSIATPNPSQMRFMMSKDGEIWLFSIFGGFEILPKSISTRNRGRRFILSEPVCAYLLDTQSGWVLLDAGLNPDNARDPTRMQERFWRHGMTAPVVRHEHLLETQLAQIGVAFADVGHVILSHLHYDHCGYLERFAHARISIQGREHSHAFSAEAGMAYFRDEYDD